MLQITDEMLNKIETDSDMLDLANKLGIPYKKMQYIVANKKAEGTPCHGCKHVAHGAFSLPCSKCSRGKEDMFEKQISDLSASIKDLHLSLRAYNCLRRAGISTIAELIECSDEELLKIRGMGLVSLEEIKTKLNNLDNGIF